MSAAVSVPEALPANYPPCSAAPALWPMVAARLGIYVELVKLRISSMVAVTVAAGFVLASTTTIDLNRLCLGVIGICLTAAASSVWNQVLERDTDRLMPRTSGRPLPSGRISVVETSTFALCLGVVGVIWLWCLVNPLTCGLSLATSLAYVLIYTPLKRRSIASTTFGAIPGAMPAVLGWTAAGGHLDLGALSLFALLFAWQFPHFLAIAWLSREQYARAGLYLWPRDERVAALTALTYALVLIPLSFLPHAAVLTGGMSTVIALCAGMWYLYKTIQFTRRRTVETARALIHTSLIYLPLVLTAFTVEHVRLWQ